MNFTEILDAHRIPYLTEGGHHHARMGWIQIDCPFCAQNSRKFHMGYSLTEKYTHCWRCGGHHVVHTLMALLDEPYRICIKLCEGIESVQTQKIKVSGTLKLPKNLGPLGPAHFKYLRRRNYDPKLIEEIWKIKGIGISSKLQWRIFIPITYRNQVVSWTTRSLSDKGARYISAPEGSESIPHKTLLYGEEYAEHSIIVCEGPLDVWRIGPGAVATFGINTTSAQVRRIAKFVVRTILFDNEKITQKRAQDLSERLSLFPGITNIAVLDAKDAGSASKKEIRRIRNAVLK